MDLFFVFSGFVIVNGYEKPLRNGYGTKRFLMERLGRIYPIHVFVLMVFLATEIAFATILGDYGQAGRQAFDESKSPTIFVSNLFLIQAWGLHDGLAWNYPNWSLSTEWAAYIFFALAMLAAPRRFWPFAVMGVVTSVAILAFVSPHGMHSYFDYAVFRSILGFCAGAIAFYVYSAMVERDMLMALPKPAWTLIEVSAMALLILAQVRFGRTSLAVLLPFFFIGLIIIFAYGRGAISDLMRTKPMVYLGVISLSVYVVHAWIIMRMVNVAQLFERWSGYDLVQTQVREGSINVFIALPPFAANVLGLVVVAVVVIVSHFTYHRVEVPGQAIFRRWAKRLSRASESQTNDTRPAQTSAGPRPVVACGRYTAAKT